ncbi:MAG: FliG C-terminal domain-containing protein [Pseudomonadota bacterium]
MSAENGTRETLPARVGALDLAAAGPVRQSGLGPAQKASIVLAALGPDAASRVLRDMGDNAIRVFARTISSMDRISPETLEEVIHEFEAALGDGSAITGGPTAARRILSEAMDDATLDQVMDDIADMGKLTVWERMAKVPPPTLARYLSGEHPQFGTVVLSRVRSDLAARVLERLPAEIARDVVMRMSRGAQLDNRVSTQIGDIIDREFLSVVQRAKSSRKPADLLADLMNQVSSASREAFLRDLEDEQPGFAAEVQRIMFTFADIPARVAPRDIARVIRLVEEPVLLAALKSAQTTAPGAVDFIMAGISKRLSERISEDLANLPEPPVKEGETSQAEVIRAIQAMAQSGELSLIEPEAPDDF